MGTDRLTWFNELPTGAAQQALLECCSAPRWAQQMAAARPYPSADEAIRQSSAVVEALTVTDLTDALAGHPRIGERPGATDSHPRAGHPRIGERPGATDSHPRAGHPRIGERPGATDSHPRAADWSRREQSGVDAEDTTTRRALTEANRLYEQRFGHIYLVCAAGRSGTELLGVLRDRLQNEPEDEWQVVRAELQKINALRLQQLMAGST
jgi:2-oxo-4-hydroxy-4-carboxy-5-ureidoimidazoline decarboxylase